ncbi:hypothetical protein SKAU_G00323770 [Synaphobranchus kaupii]|uniref:Uncharacterized protein n=1 Tax=Synaphobranchus kaupii TaxID=118154 RepID=A0A9Q1IK56_SYNKA|nr:hypothetical protein SKAU_G00323770 [Synaphobranchus kaupii]
MSRARSDTSIRGSQHCGSGQCEAGSLPGQGGGATEDGPRNVARNPPAPVARGHGPWTRTAERSVTSRGTLARFSPAPTERNRLRVNPNGPGRFPF